MDRISQLPECIIHRILSSLITSPKDLVRMSVLSKNWFNLTASFPIFYFNLHKFTKGLNLTRDIFFKYIAYTASRFYQQNLTAHVFKLITTIKEPAEFDIVNECLELVCQNGAWELVVKNTELGDAQKYHLTNALLSVSMLKSLTISNYELPSSLTVDTVKFKSLIQLKLEYVSIDDEVIKYLTTSCPLLQLFHIINCHGFKRFSVYEHQNLQKVRIHLNTSVEGIYIKAPNLSTFVIVVNNGKTEPQMNLVSCKNLKTVIYIGDVISNFLSNFPFIECLILATSYKCKNLKLSSNSLKALVLHSNCDLEDIEFTTPNLNSFVYTYSYSRLCPLVAHSSHLKSRMKCYLDGSIDYLWFQKLRRFLDKKNGFKVMNLFIHTMCSQKFKELEKIKGITLPPYELEHVELQLDTRKESSAHVAFVDVVLGCCRPRSLTLKSSVSSIGFEEVVKFACQKLLEQEDESHTKIQIMSPFSPEAQKETSNQLQCQYLVKKRQIAL